MKKAIIALMLVVSVNVDASATGFLEQPHGALYAGYVRPISNNYRFSITNNTASSQNYRVHGELCPVEFTCNEVNRNISLKPGETANDEFIIQKNVVYRVPGVRGVKAALLIQGESFWEERKEGRIDVNSN